MNKAKKTLACTTLTIFLFLSYSEWHTLPSHASAEACLTGWPSAQPHDLELSVGHNTKFCIGLN